MGYKTTDCKTKKDLRRIQKRTSKQRGKQKFKMLNYNFYSEYWKTLLGEKMVNKMERLYYNSLCYGVTWDKKTNPLCVPHVPMIKQITHFDFLVCLTISGLSHLVKSCKCDMRTCKKQC